MKQMALFAALMAALSLQVIAAAAPAGSPAAASQPAKSPEQQIDTLLAKWNRPGVPGAVIEVIRDGKVLLSKGYGFADLERSVPMTTASRFTVGSMSKQFTAFSIHLLAQEGKLSLDDDIRTYLPEVPEFGAKITVRHLLHHTSGLRDYFALMLLTGWRGDDGITQEDALTLVERQRALNFAPGQEHLYSNTGYMLLGQIVERVSGKPLADFARERIFAPLGMKHTEFLHGYGSVIPEHVLSYVPTADGGYEYVSVGDSANGAGGLVSTVGDLALWDRNFYDGRVGGMALIESMQLTGVLNSGTIAGFQSQLARFPEQHFSVVVLANTSDLDIYQMARKIADIYLDPGLAAAPEAPAAPVKTFKEVAVERAGLKALVGFYALSPQVGVEFTEEHGRLMARGTGWPKLPVFAYGERAYFAKAVDSQFTFDAPGADGVVAGGVLHQGGRDMPAQRVERPLPSPAALKKFEGDFYSDELRVMYSVASKNGALVLTYPRGSVALDFNDKGEFAVGFPVGDIKYQCSDQGSCAGFILDFGRARNLAFNRVTLGAAGAHVTAATTTSATKPSAVQQK
jgi:CubicO group peptidase (beta-lactamase class C family)